MALVPTTLDPAAKSSRLTLAGDELTVTCTTAGYAHVRSRFAVSAGKWYVEVNRASIEHMFGVVPATASLNMYPGGSSAGVGLYGTQIYRENSVVSSLASGSTGVHGMRIDADARTIVFISPTGSASSAISIPGTWDIHVAVGSGASGLVSGNVTPNFGASAFSLAPPAGFALGFGQIITYPIAGNVKDASGANVARTVRFYRRSTGEYLGSTTSNPSTGMYSFDSLYDGEVQRVVLDDDAGTLYNDLIDRVIVV